MEPGSAAEIASALVRSFEHRARLCAQRYRHASSEPFRPLGKKSFANRQPYRAHRYSELHALKIDLFLRQQGLDTTTPAGKAMFQMMGVFAEFERAMIQERVRAGLARARSEGKRLGRPPIAPALEKRIREALATPGRPGIRVIAERFGVNPSTVQRISRPFDGASVAVA